MSETSRLQRGAVASAARNPYSSLFQAPYSARCLKKCEGRPFAAHFTPVFSPQFHSGTPPIRRILRAGYGLVPYCTLLVGSKEEPPVASQSGGSSFEPEGDWFLATTPLGLHAANSIKPIPLLKFGRINAIGAFKPLARHARRHATRLRRVVLRVTCAKAVHDDSS